MQGLVTIAAVALLFSTAPSRTMASNPICWSEPRLYHPAGEYARELRDAADRHLHIRRVAGSLPAERVVSPNGAYAFHRSERPLEGRSGSTTATLAIFTEAGALLELEATDVWNMVDVKWLNEKLIFARVWLSRIGGVDLVLDVEQDKLVLTEAVADGRLLWEQAKASCQAAPTLPGCQEPCVPAR